MGQLWSINQIGISNEVVFSCEVEYMIQMKWFI